MIVMPEAPTPDRFDADEPSGLGLFHRFGPLRFLGLVWGFVAGAGVSLRRLLVLTRLAAFATR